VYSTVDNIAKLQVQHNIVDRVLVSEELVRKGHLDWEGCIAEEGSKVGFGRRVDFCQEEGQAGLDRP
jgi:hypothetical protein